MNFYECKVRYERQMENGMMKKIVEAYLVEAVSHAKAETLFIQELKSMIPKEFTVIGVKPAKVAGLFVDDSRGSEKWWKMRCAFLSLDERSGCEKRIVCTMMVQANDLQEAVVRFNMEMGKSMADYHIVSVSESKVLDVFISVGHGVDRKVFGIN